MQSLDKKNECHGQEDQVKLAQETSLQELVLWNVSKALEKSPNIPLKATIREMQENLTNNQIENLSANQQSPEQYLSCAVLAWQQLGHLSPDSLYSFIESHSHEINTNQGRASAKVSEKLLSDVLLDSGLTPPGPPRSSIGEVVMLPITAKKFIMRMTHDNESFASNKSRETQICQQQDMQFLKELQCLCGKSCTACTAGLQQMEQKEKELRQRAEQLSQRETERAELLEKATSAWVDLESKYNSRLNAAKEQAEITITKMERELEYRKALKIESKALAEKLKEYGTAAEKKQQSLREVEEQVCQRACQRLSIVEEVKVGDTALVDQQCKEAQLDRELKFKEQQARRKLFATENDLDSARALSVESERAMRAELKALKLQITAVSDQLLEEDSINTDVKIELETICSQKEELLLDLDGCKVRCDKMMERDVEELQKKTDQLKELEKKVVECKCKKPVEKSVVVKRTPSLAITCNCIEEGPDPSCTCSSLSTTILSNLLASLFRGLQSELGDAGIIMPCTLLKCFEDNHNWDKSTPVKNQLKAFFSQLLIGELDIAIAVAIEKYHARWVGSTCTDMRNIPNIDNEQAKQMKEKAIERKAQRLANKLAEDLFKERAVEMKKSAEDISQANPTSCECLDEEKNAAVYSCIVSNNVNPMNLNRGIDKNKGKIQSAGWKQTQQAVLEMKVEIENLKKASIKKEDLRMMEEKIKKVIKGNTPNVSPVEASSRVKTEITENEINAKLRHKSRKDYKPPERLKRYKFFDPPRKLGQSYAVNVCFCDQTNKQLISAKQSERSKGTTKRNHQPCPSNCICLNSEPNIDSLDKFIENWNKNMQEARLNVGGSCQKRMINNYSTDITNVTPIVDTKSSDKQSKQKCPCPVDLETSDQLKKDTSEIQSGALCSQKDCQLYDKPSKELKNVIVRQDEKQIDREADIAESKNGETEETQNKESKNDLRKAICYCDSTKQNISRIKRDCKCITDENKSIFEIIKETIIKNLGPIIGIESQNEDFCKCVHEKIDKSVKKILGTVDMEKSKYIENETNLKYDLDSVIEIPTNDKNTIEKNKVKSKNKNQEDSFETSQSSPNTLSFEDSIGDKKHKDYRSSSENSHGAQNLNTSEMENKYKENHSSPMNKIKNKNATNKNKVLTQVHAQSSEKRNKKNNKNIDQQYSNNDAIAPVQSEYIGTINLEKSNDNSKESSSIYYTQPKKDKTKIGDCSETLCDCVDYSVDLLNKLPQNNTISGGDSMYSNEREENTKSVDITTDADCGCDYKIKLLGVTLTKGAKEKKVIINKYGDKNRVSDRQPVKSNVDDINTTDHNKLKKQQQDQLGCICCNDVNQKRGFTDLEVNTFNLLEEYMKKRLEEYRISCRSHCFNPELEERMFNDIFTHVKQTVSENVKQIDCQCFEKDINDDANKKNRAYDLLQEYIKMKIDRVKCQCEDAESYKHNILHDMYEKVCNQIENDFSKIRNLYACDKTNDIQMVSAQNSPIKQTENISSQVSNTGTTNYQQECAYGPPTKEFKTIETGNSTICNCQSFECCTTPDTKNECIVQQCAPVYNQIANNFHLEQKSDSRLLEVLKLSDSFTNVDSHKMFKIEAGKPSYPYIGYTIDCEGECDNSYTCTCPKCMAKKNKSNIQDMWSISTNLRTPIKKFSYIMSSVPKSEVVDHSFIDSRININASITKQCDEQSSITNNEMILKISKENIKSMAKALDTSSFSEDMLKVDGSSDTYSKLFDINFNHFVHRRTKDGTSNVSSLSHSSCNCRKVPVCHVKMLMENIEHKLVECKCTCDALDASVCPVHSSLPPQQQYI